MITLTIKLNNLHVKQIESIEVNYVAQVQLHAIWLWHQQKKMYSPLNYASEESITGSDTKKRLTMAAAIMQGLHQRLMSLLDKNHTTS